MVCGPGQNEKEKVSWTLVPIVLPDWGPDVTGRLPTMVDCALELQAEQTLLSFGAFLWYLIATSN